MIPIFTALLLAACVPAQTRKAWVSTAASALQPPSRPWWRDTIFYELFARSFYDSNGDGIGDFNGITEKLDYLQSLGINAIWLMPINPSPSYHGYDVIDYYNVNLQYGTMDDFRRLLAEAHRRNIHVIIDLVLNHTSSQHPFFWAQTTIRIRHIEIGMFGRIQAKEAFGIPENSATTLVYSTVPCLT